MPKKRLLIVDDEPLFLRTTGELLRQQGYDCVCVSDAHQAMQQLQNQTFDLVLSDLNMPGNLKLELLHHHSENSPGVPIIVITGVPSLPTAIESLRLGINDYLLKPVRFEDLLSSIKRVLSRSSQSSRNQTRPMAARQEGPILFPEIIGESPVMLEVFDIIQRVATTDSNILITGESGTGKEVVAKTIHTYSHRCDRNFQVIDCTSIPESLFESMLFGHKKGSFTGAINDQDGLLKHCDGGTAFFDEIGELPFSLQAKLLRAVQEQTFFPVGSHTPVSVDTRFICATNRDLQLEISAGRFRQDLFYRLGVIHLELPPLRERGNDIQLLTRFFLKLLQPEHATIEGFTPEATDVLQRYSWPGNIRELRNVIERTLALTKQPLIEVSALPKHIAEHRSAKSLSDSVLFRDNQGHNPADSQPDAAVDFKTIDGVSREEMLKNTERQYLVTLLTMHQGNVTKAASQAGLSRQGLHKLLQQHDIEASNFRR